ncbi:HRDC domain-containing protein [bacterium]|nr:HRDC domain-containing protein [bacterium]
MIKRFDPSFLLKNARLIENSHELGRFLNEISDRKLIGVDTESAGFYKYHQGLNLIQIAAENCAAIIDPQAVKDFSSFQNFAKDPSREWIFHGGDFDIRMLTQEINVQISKFFDTRIAAELIGFDSLGLSSISEHFLGIRMDKKLQRCDWSRRPLTTEMKHYALLDAISLLSIRDILYDELLKMGRLDWALEEFSFALKNLNEHHDREENLFAFQIKGAGSLNKRSLAILKEIWVVREAISKENDRAPFMVLGNSTLIEISRQIPKTLSRLSSIKGVGKSFLSGYGDLILDAVKKGCSVDLFKFQTKPRKRENRRSLSAFEGELLKLLRQTRDSIAQNLNKRRVGFSRKRSPTD